MARLSKVNSAAYHTCKCVALFR